MARRRSPECRRLPHSRYRYRVIACRTGFGPQMQGKHSVNAGRNVTKLPYAKPPNRRPARAREEVMNFVDSDKRQPFLRLVRCVIYAKSMASAVPAYVTVRKLSWPLGGLNDYGRSNRSRFITLTQAPTK